MPTKLMICTNETFGLGHISRAFKVSRFLQAASNDLSILILTGSNMVHGFGLPPGVDIVKLPSLLKTSRMSYVSKYLPLPFEEVKRMREQIILETTLAYQPDCVLVDIARWE